MDNISSERPNDHSGGQFEQVVERLRSANNVLVTVTSNPSVDQLSACLGLTIVLNKLGKHATAVFSGDIPSTIDFLHPEKTLEKNTDSLRDFIIALDKSKADKLRYKVEDSVVKIFITPYKTSIDEKDLDFSQGDFNIDAVVALGVHDKSQLDATILAHGRILHDAAVMSLNTETGKHLGSISWIEANASSLSEMVSDVARDLSQNVFDEQISTALLTGIVSETERFSNQKASPHTMSIAGILMAAGASAQLVTTKLEEAKNVTEAPATDQPNTPKNDDGLMEIHHDKEENYSLEEEDVAAIAPNITPKEDKKPTVRGIHPKPLEPSENPLVDTPPPVPKEPEANQGESVSNHVVFEPPRLGGQLTANSIPEYKQYSDTTDPLSKVEDNKSPILSRDEPKSQVSMPDANSTLSDIESSVGDPHENRSDHIAADNKRTLSEIEQVVESPHLHQNDTEPIDKEMPKENNSPQVPNLDEAQAAVAQAAQNEDSYRPEPIDALGAQPVDLDFGNGNQENNESEPPEANGPSSPPPPVPPPMMPPGV